jgi:spermidine/putrescine-binding protein
MQPKDMLAGLAEGRLSRRQFLAGLSSLGIVATTFRIAPRAFAADVNLSVFTWADYDNAVYHQKFIDKHGGSPTFSIFGESEEALQKLRGGFKQDVVHPCTSDLRRWKDAGILKPIDTKRLDQWNNVFPSIQKIPGVMMDGQQYHMPWDWGNESILYRTDKVDIKEESLSLMLDERYKGQLAMYDSVDSMTGLGGKLAGIADPFNMNDEEIEKTVAVWKKVHSNLRFYWTDNTEAQQAIATGELVAAWAWNEAVMNLTKEGVPVKYMKPKEGMFTWVCGLALTTNGPGSEDQAYDFLNAMLDPDSGKNLIENFGYGHSNRKSFDLVDPELVKQMGLSDLDGMLATTNFYQEIPPDTKEKLVAKYDEVKAGI